MKKDEPLHRFMRKIPGSRFEPAGGEATLCALAVETDDRTGLALRVAAVRLGGLEEAGRGSGIDPPMRASAGSVPKSEPLTPAETSDVIGLLRSRHLRWESGAAGPISRFAAIRRISSI